MSRIGRKPIAVPAGVTVKIDGSQITVKGAKATLTRDIHPNMSVSLDNGVLTVTRPDDSAQNRALHGLTRTLVSNMVEGVDKGFKKDLEVNGVGYKVALQGKNLVLNVGYSHQVNVEVIDGITVEVPAPTKITVSGADKQAVGQYAANLRKIRPPEPYGGTGIKYSTEVIRRKEGKTGAKKK